MANEMPRELDSSSNSLTTPPSATTVSKRKCFPKGTVTWPCFKAFFLKNFLVIGLVTAIVFSLACPWPGRAVASVKVGSWAVFQTINIVTIFIISGLTLKTDAIKDALRQWYAAIAGIISIMLITPCAAFVLVELPFNPAAYKYGLAIFALVPTTIASGITLVSAARGNAALALMLTVVTNVLCVFILPFTVPLVISQAQNVSLSASELLLKLSMTILVPLIIGKILREAFSWVRKQVDAHKVALGLINNGSLICIVWQTLSAAQEEVVNTAFGTLCLIALAAILLHVAYLIVNYVLIKIFRLPYPEGAAVLVMGSEKTLPMAVTVIAALPVELGPSGQFVVPCVLAHISQVLIDAFLTARMGNRELARQEEVKLKNSLPETMVGAAVDGVDRTGTNSIQKTEDNGVAEVLPPPPPSGELTESGDKPVTTTTAAAAPSSETNNGFSSSTTTSRV